jgi:adenylylsulfate kinase
MRHLADGVVMAGKIAVTDFVCPTEEARKAFDPDFTVWMDTIKEGRFEDTNKVFVNPPHCDYHVKDWFDDTHQALLPVVQTWMERHD